MNNHIAEDPASKNPSYYQKIDAVFLPPMEIHELKKLERRLQVTKDYKEAAKWFRLAAHQGNVHAHYNLGWLYWQGKGVIKNYCWRCQLRAVARAGSRRQQLSSNSELGVVTSRSCFHKKRRARLLL